MSEFPLRVMAEFELVRRSCRVNTEGMKAVQSEAFDMDCHHLVVWIEELGRNERDKYKEMIQEAADTFKSQKFSDDDLRNMSEKELNAALVADDL